MNRRHFLARLHAALLIGTGDAPGADDTPGVRNAHGMAYDEHRGLTLLFGGADASSVRDDTWAWDGRRWRALAVRGPTPRTFPAFTWDASRGEAVLFGGRRVLFGRQGERATCLGDTWVLRASVWQRQMDGPPRRSEAGITFDRGRGVAVLFGGYHDDEGHTTRLGDTWEWDGSRWQQRAQDGPAPRSGVAMCYDETLHRVVLFGGSDGPRADTWTWDGRRWDQVRTPQTPGRFNSLAFYDPNRRRLVRTTGWNGKERVRETVDFDGKGWTSISSSGPSPRNHSALAFDRRRGCLVLYGGHDGTFVFGDTWEWDGRTWRQRVAAPPERRLENGH